MKQQKKSLTHLEMSSKIKLMIPKKVGDQIKYLCDKISQVEWSGVLFYSVKGNINDPENMVLTTEDILLMDKGSSGYTEYNLDKDVMLHWSKLGITNKMGHKNGCVQY